MRGARKPGECLRRVLRTPLILPGGVPQVKIYGMAIFDAFVLEISLVEVAESLQVRSTLLPVARGRQTAQTPILLSAGPDPL